MFVSPAFVSPVIALETPELRGFCHRTRGVALPSEGRGRWFESNWVRHLKSKAYEGFGPPQKQALFWVMFVLRHSVPDAFARLAPPPQELNR